MATDPPSGWIDAMGGADRPPSLAKGIEKRQRLSGRARRGRGGEQLLTLLERGTEDRAPLGVFR